MNRLRFERQTRAPLKSGNVFFEEPLNVNTEQEPIASPVKENCMPVGVESRIAPLGLFCCHGKKPKRD